MQFSDKDTAMLMTALRAYQDTHDGGTNARLIDDLCKRIDSPEPSHRTTGLLEGIQSLIRPNESLRLDVRVALNSSVTVMITPILSSNDEEGMSDEAKAARAQLARPMRMTGPASEIDQALLAVVSATAPARGELGDALDSLLDGYKETAKATRNAATAGAKASPTKKKAAAKKGGKTKSASSVAKPETAKPQNPGSLL